MTASTSLRAATLLVLAGLTITACGVTPSASPAPSTQPAPPEDGGTYASVYDLQKAYIKAGGECEDGKYWGFVSFANGTIECDHDTMIDVFDDTDAILNYQARDRAQGYGAAMLQGSNWLIRSTPDDHRAMKEKLGGTIVSYTAKG